MTHSMVISSALIKMEDSLFFDLGVARPVVVVVAVEEEEYPNEANIDTTIE